MENKKQKNMEIRKQIMESMFDINGIMVESRVDESIRKEILENLQDIEQNVDLIIKGH